MENTSSVYSGSEKTAGSLPIVTADLQAQPELEVFSADTAIAPCATCGYTKGNVVRMPAGCTHYAALKCGRCDRWLRWLPKPENKARKQKTQKGGIR